MNILPGPRHEQWAKRCAVGMLLLRWLTVLGARAEEARVIVVSPHNEAIRYEFGHRFAQWHLERHHEPASVEWRDIGGSTDAFRFIRSEFARKPTGIGIDCFFGGGLEPYLRLADLRLSQPYQPPPDILNGIPQSFNGVDVIVTIYGF